MKGLSCTITAIASVTYQGIQCWHVTSSKGHRNEQRVKSQRGQLCVLHVSIPPYTPAVTFDCGVGALSGGQLCSPSPSILHPVVPTPRSIRHLLLRPISSPRASIFFPGVHCDAAYLGGSTKSPSQGSPFVPRAVAPLGNDVFLASGGVDVSLNLDESSNHETPTPPSMLLGRSVDVHAKLDTTTTSGTPTPRHLLQPFGRGARGSFSYPGTSCSAPPLLLLTFACNLLWDEAQAWAVRQSIIGTPFTGEAASLTQRARSQRAVGDIAPTAHRCSEQSVRVDPRGKTSLDPLRLGPEAMLPSTSTFGPPA